MKTIAHILSAIAQPFTTVWKILRYTPTDIDSSSCSIQTLYSLPQEFLNSDIMQILESTNKCDLDKLSDFLESDKMLDLSSTEKGKYSDMIVSTVRCAALIEIGNTLIRIDAIKEKSTFSKLVRGIMLCLNKKRSDSEIFYAIGVLSYLLNPSFELMAHIADVCPPLELLKLLSRVSCDIKFPDHACYDITLSNLFIALSEQSPECSKCFVESNLILVAVNRLSNYNAECTLDCLNILIDLLTSHKIEGTSFQVKEKLVENDIKSILEKLQTSEVDDKDKEELMKKIDTFYSLLDT